LRSSLRASRWSASSTAGGPSRHWHASLFGTLTIVVTLTWWGMDWILELGRHPGAFAAFGCVLLAGALAALLCAPALSTGRTG
jgi:hypothetical protein